MASCSFPPRLLRTEGNSSCLPLASCFLVISSTCKHITGAVCLRWQERHYVASWRRKGGLQKVMERERSWVAELVTEAVTDGGQILHEWLVLPQLKKRIKAWSRKPNNCRPVRAADSMTWLLMLQLYPSPRRVKHLFIAAVCLLVHLFNKTQK